MKTMPFLLYRKNKVLFKTVKLVNKMISYSNFSCFRGKNLYNDY